MKTTHGGVGGGQENCASIRWCKYLAMGELSLSSAQLCSTDIRPHKSRRQVLIHKASTQSMNKTRTHLKYIPIILANRPRSTNESTIGFLYKDHELLHSLANTNQLQEIQSTTWNNNKKKQLLSPDTTNQTDLKRKDVVYLNTLCQRSQDENTFCSNASRSD